MPLMIDGKEVKRFLFVRYSFITKRNHPVEVHAFNKDHAVARLEQKFPYIQRLEWDFVDQLGGDQTLGKLGEILPLNPFATSNG